MVESRAGINKIVDAEHQKIRKNSKWRNTAIALGMAAGSYLIPMPANAEENQTDEPDVEETSNTEEQDDRRGFHLGIAGGVSPVWFDGFARRDYSLMAGAQLNFFLPRTWEASISFLYEASEVPGIAYEDQVNIEGITYDIMRNERFDPAWIVGLRIGKGLEVNGWRPSIQLGLLIGQANREVDRVGVYYDICDERLEPYQTMFTDHHTLVGGSIGIGLETPQLGNSPIGIYAQLHGYMMANVTGEDTRALNQILRGMEVYAGFTFGPRPRDQEEQEDQEEYYRAEPQGQYTVDQNTGRLSIVSGSYGQSRLNDRIEPEPLTLERGEEE